MQPSSPDCEAKEMALADVEAPKSLSGSDSNDAAEDCSLDRKILLKTDLTVLSLLVVTATLEFLDKNALAYAAVWGLRTDTGLVGQE